MNGPVSKLARCAIYTRKSTEYNLELAFNSLDAQREACEAYIKSQAHEGWRAIADRYDDGAFSGASLDRPALQKLLADVGAGKITSCWCTRWTGSGERHEQGANDTIAPVGQSHPKSQRSAPQGPRRRLGRSGRT